MATDDPPVVFVTAALARAEETAKAAGCAEIEAVDYLWETKYLNLSQPNGTVKQTTEFSAELADHFALNSPAAVLRRVAADRQILDEHHNTNDGDCAACVVGKWGYPTHGGCSPAPWPCRTVLLLAQAWGWTEETT